MAGRASRKRRGRRRAEEEEGREVQRCMHKDSEHAATCV